MIWHFNNAFKLSIYPHTGHRHHNSKGLPIGLQVMVKAWDEKTLLRLALTAEQAIDSKAPQVYFETLK